MKQNVKIFSLIAVFLITMVSGLFNSTFAQCKKAVKCHSNPCCKETRHCGSVSCSRAEEEHRMMCGDADCYYYSSYNHHGWAEHCDHYWHDDCDFDGWHSRCCEEHAVTYVKRCNDCKVKYVTNHVKVKVKGAGVARMHNTCDHNDVCNTHHSSCGNHFESCGNHHACGSHYSCDSHHDNCGTCHYREEIVCKKCMGEGRVLKYADCNICSGNGKWYIVCPKCEGTGTNNYCYSK